MKLTAGKRVLMFFHWLMSLLIAAAFVVYVMWPDFARKALDAIPFKLNDMQRMIVGIAILAIYVILTVAVACVIFHRGSRADRGFITVDSSDTGRVRIAISAIEQMVRQSVNSIDGIADMRIGIENMDDAIGINIAATINSGRHVPTITMNMQRAIRQFVEMNCGVAVRTVSISINGVTAAGESSKRGGRRRRGESAVEPAPEFVPVAQADTSVPEAPVVESEPVIPEPVAYESAVEPAPAPVAYEPEPQPATVVDEPEPYVPHDPEPITLRLDRTGQEPYEVTADAGYASGDVEAPDFGDDIE